MKSIARGDTEEPLARIEQMIDNDRGAKRCKPAGGQMVRRFLWLFVIAACTGAGVLLAAERATLILTDGERMSGTVVSRGGNRNRGRDDVSRGDLILRTDEGREIPIRLEQVAVIQFGGGRPAPAELDALPYDNAQMIVRSNGSFESGRFIDMAPDSEVIRWQAPNGRQQLIPFRNLTRIYLNTGRARTAFSDTDRFNPGFRDRRNPRVETRNEPGFGNGNNRGAGASRTGLAAEEVRVEANEPWTDTGLTVQAGDLVSFRASGRINFGQGGTATAGPDGNDTERSPANPVSAMRVGGLIGRVGNSAPFPIGADIQPIRMPADGPLMLGVNDQNLGDNGGFFSVAITEQDFGNGNNRGVGTSGTRLGAGEVRVEANQPWTDTGLTVQAGDLLAFRASGRINYGQGGTATAGPDGNDTLRSPANPVSQMPVGGLIGRVGNSAPFRIGSNAQPIRMPADGPLMLGVNDQNLEDNSGYFTVSITER
jgi:hypothetical protein